MKDYTILIVEDNELISKYLKLILEKNFTKILINKTGENLIKDVKESHLILMDIMLPFNDGISLSEEIKRSTNIPIIFLTARDDINTKLNGLHIGDDYIVKPFDPRELISRINNQLNKFYDVEILKIKHLTIYIKYRSVYVNENLINLTRTESAILFYLVENINLILTKEQFFNYIWGNDEVFENILNVYIKRLRKKLLDENGEVIQTIFGIGYKLNSR